MVIYKTQFLPTFLYYSSVILLSSQARFPSLLNSYRPNSEEGLQSNENSFNLKLSYD